MIGDHLEGFGFLKNVAIDQHLLARNREFDLLEVIEKYPELLGIGIDEGTAIVVSGDTFEVVGNSKVAIYDEKSKDRKREKFYFLSAGDTFNLQTRTATPKIQKPENPPQTHELTILFPKNSSTTWVNRMNTFQKHAKLFEAAHEGVKITFVFLPSESYHSSLVKRMEEKQPMDLVFGAYDAELSHKGTFADLLPFYKSEGMTTDDIYKPLIDFATVNGKLTGIPMTPDPMVVFYHKGWFRVAGLPEPTDDWTWEQFFNTSILLKDANAVQGREIYGSAVPMELSLFETLAHSKGKSLLSPDGSTFSGYFDSPVIAEAVAGLVTGVDNSKAIKQTSSPYNDMLTELRTGNAGMGVSKALNYSFLLRAWDAENVGVVSVPRLTSSVRANSVSISTLSIAAASEQQPLAWKFMKDVILNPESGFQRDWAKQEMLTSKAAIQQWKLTEDAGMKVMYEELNYAVSPSMYRNPKLQMLNMTTVFKSLLTAHSPAAVQKRLTEAASSLDKRLAQIP
ncbi:hypothetical protein PAESOLCIP111_05839 [Paenibacillus solanacearum]|uniref:Extracellular solute-binding protein n=1 Tax=Paenibacillus solanacearum TaxID=2048548 RepID=A0A916K768_9BACL|nr:extracellular solute-binding protein [Paenibacillus solanacearum]CAG7649315.1 hypothetical protein PAESOLCIP111_05839 [Paenibacillus solanacearum]